MPANDRRRLAEMLARELGDDDTVADDTDDDLLVTVTEWVEHQLEEIHDL